MSHRAAPLVPAAHVLAAAASGGAGLVAQRLALSAGDLAAGAGAGASLVLGLWVAAWALGAWLAGRSLLAPGPALGALGLGCSLGALGVGANAGRKAPCPRAQSKDAVQIQPPACWGAS